MKDLLEQYRRASEGVPKEGALSREKINTAIASVRRGIAAEVKDTLQISDLEKEKISLLTQIIEHPEFQAMIERGEITFAMIKPEPHKAKDGVIQNEQEVSDAIKGEVAPPLKVLFSQDFFIPKKQGEDFYKNLSHLPFFQRVVNFMSGGAITALILHSDEGNAVQAWREQIGPTNPEKPDTQGRTDRIRHRYASRTENNVVHGSDSIESVKREIEWFKQLLGAL